MTIWHTGILRKLALLMKKARILIAVKKPKIEKMEIKKRKRKLRS